MSIYVTLWRLKFPRYGDDHSGCDWVAVLAQGVPAHVGRSFPGPESEQEDPYSPFLLPVGTVPTDDDGQTMRTVVFVTEGTPKGTARSPQEYVKPLLVLSGQEYTTIAFGELQFGELHQMICDALRGGRPRLVAEVRGPDGRVRLLFDDGSAQGTESGFA